MTAKKTTGFSLGFRIFILGFVILVGGCFILGQVGLSTPKPSYTTTPLTLSEFESQFTTDRALPRTASNLYFASSQVGFTGFLRMYRFDAPVTDCLAYGKQLLLANDPAVKPDMKPVKSPSNPVQGHYLGGMGLSEVNWFDIERIRGGVEANREPSTQPQMSFWIDTDRGRFYFYSSD